jgi:hypothetical protein
MQESNEKEIIKAHDVRLEAFYGLDGSMQGFDIYICENWTGSRRTYSACCTFLGISLQ